MGVHRTTMVKSVKKPAKAEFPLNLVEKKPRTFSIGGDILPKQDLTRRIRDRPQHPNGRERTMRLTSTRIPAATAKCQVRQSSKKMAGWQVARRRYLSSPMEATL